jgi:Ala-tRNA(Pro) deacylase
MKCKDRLETYLRENQVAYQVQHHPSAFTAQDVAAKEHIPGKQLAKVVMVMADSNLVMLVVPAPGRVDLPGLAGVLGAKDARLAEESEFANSFPDCELGAMPPFGNLYDMPAYIDRSLANEDTIFFQAGTHTDTMSIKYADFARLVQPNVAEFTL